MKIIRAISKAYITNKKIIINKFKLSQESSKVDRDDCYFANAKSRSDDVYLSAIVSRNRYRFIACILLGIAALFLLCILMLVPAQHMEPLLIHHYQDGRVVIEKGSDTPQNLLESSLQSDLIRYVVNRESYDPIAYEEQYRLVLMMSASGISKQFIDQQSPSNKHSLMRLLNNHAYRTVHVEDIIILDNELNNNKKSHHHKNLAEIHFNVTDHVLSSGSRKDIPYTALVSWAYSKPSSNPDVRWRNWDGFIVSSYQRNQRNLKG